MKNSLDLKKKSASSLKTLKNHSEKQASENTEEINPIMHYFFVPHLISLKMILSELHFLFVIINIMVISNTTKIVRIVSRE